LTQFEITHSKHKHHTTLFVMSVPMDHTWKAHPCGCRMDDYMYDPCNKYSLRTPLAGLARKVITEKWH